MLFGLLPLSCQAQDITVLSPGTPTPVVAPDSIFTIQGLSLTVDPQRGAPDDTGKLPTTLGGVMVLMGGVPAQLVYVSPDHVNAICPAATPIGKATVSLTYPDGTSQALDDIFIRRVSPALLFDDHDRNRGAMLNPATGARDPFRVQTPENSTTDKRTRLRVYGTGFRYAGDTTVDPKKIDPLKQLAASGVDLAGKVWTLTVEQAGIVPAPKPDTPDITPVVADLNAAATGLDQAVLILPAGLDAAGLVTVTLTAEGVPSNSVTMIVASLTPPVIKTVTPASAPPGSFITISGTGFVAEPVVGALDRNRIVFQYGDGQQLSVLPISAAVDTLTFLLPALLQPEPSLWDEGAVKLCLDVDERRVCAPDNAFAAGAAAVPVLPPGQTLLDSLNQGAQTANDALEALGEHDYAAELLAVSNQWAADLQVMVNSARAGTPPTILLTGPDGAAVPTVFDLAQFTKIEALLTANNASLRIAAPTRTKQRAATVDCRLPEERKLLDTSEQYQKLVSIVADSKAVLSAAVTLEIVLACIGGWDIGGPPGCAEAVAVVVRANQWALFPIVYGMMLHDTLPILKIESGNNFLQSLAVTPQPATGDKERPGPVVVAGRFVPTFAGVTQDLIVSTIAKRVAASLVDVFYFGRPEITVVIKPIVSAGVKQVVKQILKDNPGLLPTQAGPPTPFLLGESTVTSAPEWPEASLRLECGTTEGQVTTKTDLTRIVPFTLSARPSNKLLLFQPKQAPPSVVFNLKPCASDYYGPAYANYGLVEVPWTVRWISNPSNQALPVFLPSPVIQLLPYSLAATVLNSADMLALRLLGKCPSGSRWGWQGHASAASTEPYYGSASTLWAMQTTVDSQGDSVVEKQAGTATDPKLYPGTPAQVTLTRSSTYDRKTGVQQFDYTYTISVTSAAGSWVATLHYANPGNHPPQIIVYFR
ncbi:MAG: hypothetical protein NTY38_29235 [Acidobacteria bacterium]|nr:hypothetical protein [Acidobacteriota bacterium]